VLHTGDVTGEDSTDYEFTAGLLAQIDCPQVYLPGNHDLLSGLEQWLCRRETGPVCEYQFSGLQIVCLDSSRYGADHAGWLNEAQLAQLEQICHSEDPRPLIIATHHHPIAVDVPWLDALGLLNGPALHEILLSARHRLRGVFFGHIHHSVDIIKDGILYSGVASAAYQFAAWPGQVEAALDLAADPGFNLVTVTPQQTFVRHHRYRFLPRFEKI
jgi:Icc protein